MGELLFLLAFLLIFAVNAHTKAQRKKLTKAAYDFSPTNVHGGAKFASDDDLRKAGLFK